jgi:hypothetical protein
MHRLNFRGLAGTKSSGTRNLHPPNGKYRATLLPENSQLLFNCKTFTITRGGIKKKLCHFILLKVHNELGIMAAKRHLKGQPLEIFLSSEYKNVLGVQWLLDSKKEVRIMIL